MIMNFHECFVTEHPECQDYREGLETLQRLLVRASREAAMRGQKQVWGQNHSNPGAGDGKRREAMPAPADPLAAGCSAVPIASVSQSGINCS